ncbi:MAG: acylphosphatase [Euryarchaeota archaeon]|nr:acylphosphatase [Euryarchaeota archaeon]
MKAKKIMIKGLVHDVGYRLFLLTETESLFIENFDARNIVVDAEQHLVVQVRGPEEKINRFVEFARSNYPPDASVLAVEVEDYTEEVRSIESFRQSFMVLQMAKLAQTGVGMLKKQDSMLGKQDVMIEKQDVMIEKQDVMIEKQDVMIEKQDVMIEKQDVMIEKQDVMLEKQDETINAIREESGKTRMVVSEEVTEIKTTLRKVKEKVGMV